MSDQNGNQQSDQFWVWEDVDPVLTYAGRAPEPVTWTAPIPEFPAVSTSEPEPAPVDVLERAAALEAEGRFRDALSQLKKALASGDHRSELYGAAGHLQAQQGFFDEAAESFRLLLELEPSNRVALDQAICLAKAGRWNEAAETFEDFATAPDEDETSDTACFGLGVCQIALHNPEAALESFRAGLHSARFGESCRIGAGVALQLLGRNEEAAEVYRQVLQRNPTSTEVVANLSLIEAGQPDTRLLTELLESQPDLREALEGLASVALSVGDYRQAARYCQKLTEVAPSYEAWFNLGVAWEEVGRREDASRAYSTAVKFRPDCEEALVNLGVLYYESGDIPAAQKAFERALNNDRGRGSYVAKAALAMTRPDTTNRFTSIQ